MAAAISIQVAFAQYGTVRVREKRLAKRSENTAGLIGGSLANEHVRNIANILGSIYL